MNGIGIFMGVGIGSSGKSKVVLYDSFNRADGPPVKAETGQTYTVGGTPTISNNALIGSGTITADTGISDGRASLVDVTPAMFSSLGFRYVDGNNLLKVSIEGTAPGTYALLRRVAGTYTTLISSAVVPANGDRVDVVTNGSSIAVLINNVQIGSVTETFNQTATKISVFVNTGGAVDNLLVESL